MHLTFFLLLSLASSGLALKCHTCGTDGVCRNGTEEKSITCDHELSCMLGSKVEEQYRWDVKGCFSGAAWNVTASADMKFSGCVKVTSDMPGGMDDDLCLCNNADDCNQVKCDPYDCNCPFSDPEDCSHVDHDGAIECYQCQNDVCAEGEEAELKMCDRGEKTCMLSRSTVRNPDTNKTEIVTSRMCALVGENQLGVRGCLQAGKIPDAKHFDGVIESVESCFCDARECNKDYCDSKQCSCLFSDPNNCIKNVAALKNAPIFILIASYFFLDAATS